MRRAHGYSFLRFPDRCILTGRYHLGRERAKICQYIHLVSCVAMFCEVAPARGIPFREGTSAGVPQHILCKLRESRNDVTGAVNWKSERLLTFPCRDVVLGKCGQSECHGAIIDKCDLVRVSHMMLLSRTARRNLRKRGAEQTQYP